VIASCTRCRWAWCAPSRLALFALFGVLILLGAGSKLGF
jgi:hypothetical protein